MAVMVASTISIICAGLFMGAAQGGGGALDAADANFLKEIEDKREIAGVMRGALAVAVFGGILSSGTYGRALTEIRTLLLDPHTLPRASRTAWAVDRITSCAIAQDVQLHILDHGSSMAGDRRRYFDALERLWSTRCRR